MSVVELTLTRAQAQPWGFRLQGGVDFEKALVIASVVDGSPSDQSGLKGGDVLLSICGQDAGLLTHKAAQAAVIEGGDRVPLVVRRGAAVESAAGVWKPQVALVGSAPVQPGLPGQTYTKTSLAASRQPEEDHWDVRHNITAKGFPSNSSTGNLPPGLNQQAANNSSTPSGFRSVSAPVTKPTAGSVPRGPPQQQVCFVCQRVISGVFVQVKVTLGLPLHADCFSCCTCGASLKNVGHFNIGDRLYCAQHVKDAQGGQSQVEQQGPPQGHQGPPQGYQGPPQGHQGLPQGYQGPPQGHQGPPQGQQGPPQGQQGPPLALRQGLAVNLANIGRRQNPPQGGDNRAAWEAQLNSNAAGLADNAEDFTKAFMSQLMGNQ